MRVVLVVSSLNGGGAERFAVLLANNLCRYGFEVSIIVTYSKASSCVYSVDKNVEVISLYDHVSSSRIKNNYFYRLYKLGSLIRQKRPDCVISFLSNVNIACLLALPFFEGELIVSERIHPAHADLGIFYRSLRFFLYRFADKVVVQTKEGEKWLKHNLYLKNNTVVIPNFTELSSPNITKQSNIYKSLHDKHVFNIIAVGRLEYQKGFDTLILSMRYLKLKNIKFSLTIFGDGAMFEELSLLVQSLHLQDSIRFPGRVDDMIEHYMNADLFVLSSRFEGFPNVLLEACSLGVPVVSFACPSGPVDILKGFDDLLVYDLDSPESLANAIYKSYLNPLRYVVAADLSNDVSFRFSKDSVLRKWLSLIMSSHD